MSFIKQGKVKDVYSTDLPQILEFRFSNRISVFDKIIPTEIPDKGATLCQTSTYWFNEAEKLGINTHFIDNPSPNSMRVLEVDIIPDYSKITPTTTDYLIPLEWIARYNVAGSLHDRLQRGETKPETLGFSSGYQPKLGEELPKSFFEVTTKLEKVDRPVTKQEALKIGGLTEDEWNEIWKQTYSIDERINQRVREKGLIHADGKKEWAFDEERNPILVDTFGTPDEDRFWDLGSYRQGKLVELSKEFVRQHYRQTGYHDKLMESRKKGLPEPDIPPLPEDIVQKTRKIYIDLTERMTGSTFVPA